MKRVPNYRRLSALATLSFTCTAAALLCVPALAQDTGAAPQSAAANPGDTGTISSSAAVPAPATPPVHHSRHLAFGPEIGLYLPTSGKTRDRFGSTWFSIGIGLGDIIPARPGGELGLDLNVIGQSRGDRHAYIAPIGLQYREALVTKGSSIPYIGVSADLVLADVRSTQDNAHSGLRSTGGGSVFIGTTLGRRSYAEVRYIATGSVQSFNLSGLNLTAGLRF